MELWEIADRLEALPILTSYADAEKLTEEDKQDLRNADTEIQVIYDAIVEHADSHDRVAETLDK